MAASGFDEVNRLIEFANETPRTSRRHFDSLLEPGLFYLNLAPS